VEIGKKKVLLPLIILFCDRYGLWNNYEICWFFISGKLLKRGVAQFSPKSNVHCNICQVLKSIVDITYFKNMR
jgi:hypothetical protein